MDKDEAIIIMEALMRLAKHNNLSLPQVEKLLEKFKLPPPKIICPECSGDNIEIVKSNGRRRYMCEDPNCQYVWGFVE